MPTSALHVARTGLEAQDTRMRVIANNLANVGTTGFKRDRANFATLAYQDARVAGQQSSSETAYATGLNLGTGVGIQSTTRIDTQGTLNTTGNALDMALDTIAADGTVSAVVAGSTEAAQLGQITIASFANPGGLQAMGDNFLTETGASGPAQLGVAGEGGRGHIRQGMLEASNVNIVEELVDMIECQRAYEINSKMISAVDEMLRNANQTL